MFFFTDNISQNNNRFWDEENQTTTTISKNTSLLKQFDKGKLPSSRFWDCYTILNLNTFDFLELDLKIFDFELKKDYLSFCNDLDSKVEMLNVYELQIRFLIVNKIQFCKNEKYFKLRQLIFKGAKQLNVSVAQKCSFVGRKVAMMMFCLLLFLSICFSLS